MQTSELQQAEAGIPNLIRKVLGSPHAEQIMKGQIILLASQNLHVPEVTTALLEVLPLTKDKETKDKLLYLLANLNTSRFSDLDKLYDILIDVFNKERDRAVRVDLLHRLQAGLHQDQRLVGLFLELMAKELLSEPERIIVIDSLIKIPSINESVALIALQRSAYAPDHIQAQAIALAERCPMWSDAIAEVLTTFLQVKNNRENRFRILEKLAEAKKLTPAFAPALIQVLQTDTETTFRLKAMDLLTRIKPWDANIVAQLLWSARNDGDESIRSRAADLQREIPELADEQLISLAQIMSTDRALGVRTSILDILKPVTRIKSIRDAVATAFASNPSVFDDEEFSMLLGMLTPYAGREDVIREMLLKSIENLPNVAQRQQVLQLVIPKLKIENVLETIIRLFTKERDESIRSILFQQIRSLSITRNPALVDVFCSELTEPSSPYRQTCAATLSLAAEMHEQIPVALEDVLLNDQDRELIRVCLEGYLRPGVDKKFNVLLEVVRNEVLDTTSRQQCLTEIMKLSLSSTEQEQLAEALAGLKPNTLKT